MVGANFKNRNNMDFSVLEEEESVIKLTVIAIGEIPERAINYLQEKNKLIQICMC